MAAIPRIFISATSDDLGSYRQAVSDVLLTRGTFPVQQNHFSVTHQKVKEKLTERIDSCDAVICLIGFVYGKEPRERPSSEPRMSYTQLERQIAEELHKPVFLFLAHEDCPFDNSLGEIKQTRKCQKFQLDYRKKICEGDQDYHFFNDVNELKALVATLSIPQVSEVPDVKAPMGPEDEPADPNGNKGAIPAGAEESPVVAPSVQIQSAVEHTEEVKNRVTEHLGFLSPETFTDLEGCIYGLDQSGSHRPVADDRKQALAETMVKEFSIDAIIQQVVHCTESPTAQDDLNLTELIYSLLPLRYYPDEVLARFQQDLEGSVGLVEAATATMTLAEVIMASYDKRPLKYNNSSEMGLKALRSGPVSPVGIDPDSSDIVKLYAAKEILRYLTALKDRDFLEKKVRPVAPDFDQKDSLDEEALRREIQGYAVRLNAVFSSRGRVEQKEWSTYCVLEMPKEDFQRRFYREVLETVHSYLPSLFFVEMVTTDAASFSRDFSMEYLIQSRWSAERKQV